MLPDKIALLIGKPKLSILQSYLNTVGNAALLQYRHPDHFQWGAKDGESLYTHILNGIFLLDTLRETLGLSDVETRTLFTAYTVHDINKMVDEKGGFNRLSRDEVVEEELARLNLPDFFPDWRTYFADIVTLIRSHGGATHTVGESLFAKAVRDYGLGRERVLELTHLMKAVDIIDLSHTLNERRHKATFLGHLNAYLAACDAGYQLRFVTHQLAEQRGLLSNILHQAITDELVETCDAIPLLYYPDGVAYLMRKDRPINNPNKRKMGKRAAQTIANITRSNYADFITITNQGIKVAPKCLELGVPFAGEVGSIWREMYNKVQRRNLGHEKEEANARAKAEKAFAKSAKAAPAAADTVRAALDSKEPITAQAESRLRVAELIRTYYIFLKKHFPKQIPDAWKHIYQLLELPAERHDFYSYFDALYARAYVVVTDTDATEETIYRTLEADGAKRVDVEEDAIDPKAAILEQYAEQSVVIGGTGEVTFDAHLAQYVTNQHKQCVHCSSTFATDRWMSGDVRDDITVQTFSNRLRGGGSGEPKKRICALCQIQFLLEALNYPPVRDEDLHYLHFFPYSFLTAPFLDNLRQTFMGIVEEARSADAIELQALNMDAPNALTQWQDKHAKPPAVFRPKTKKGKAQPYGFYLPHYSQTVGNVLTLPINGAGSNAGEKFLFSLWNALVLQRHFGMKVLFSSSAVPALDKTHFGDLYVDSIPIALCGLLPDNDYRHFRAGASRKEHTDNLPILWQKALHIFKLRDVAGDFDAAPRLIRALGTHPLMIFHETDRLLEAKAKKQKGSGGLTTWSYQAAFTPVTQLAHLQGGRFMTQLHQALQKSAEIAWSNRIIGRSLERSSLLYAYDELQRKFTQLQGSKTLDLETVKAAAAQDIFDHLERLAKQQGYNIGRKKREACIQFVSVWFDEILPNVYEGNMRKLISDEKMLRSAYLFYIRGQIPQKSKKE